MENKHCLMSKPTIKVSDQDNSIVLGMGIQSENRE